MKLFILFTLWFSAAFAQTTDTMIEGNYVSGISAESNLVRNPSARKHSGFVSTTNATATRDTSAGKKIDNTASFSVDASALNGFAEWARIPASDEQISGNCEFKGLFSGDASLYRAQITDGSGVTINQTQVLGSTYDSASGTYKWRPFSVNATCAADGVRKIRITQTEAGTAPAINVGKLYYGLATNLSSGVPPNTFTAQVSSTGVLSDIVNSQYFNGTTFAPTDTSSFAIGFKDLSSAPNCNVTPQSSSLTEQYAAVKTSAETTSGVNIRTSYNNTTSSFTKFAVGFTITCTKTGSDYIQPAITSQNYNYGDTAYTATVTNGPTISTSTFTHARNGSKITLKGYISASGSGSASTMTISPPPGITLATGAPESIGYGVFNDSGVALKGATVLIQSSTSIVFFLEGAAAALQGGGFTSGDYLRYEITIPAIQNGVPWTETLNAPQLVGSVIADTSIKADKSAGVTSVDYGTYTPSGTAVTNVSAITPSITSYVRIGSIVFVSGVVSVDPTAGSAAFSWRLSLPVPSNFTDTTDASGTFGSNGSGSDIGANVNQIRADAANDQVLFSGTLTSALHGVVGIPFQFMYRVL